MSVKTSRKLRVAVMFGGRSGEHEVSLRSGASVIQHLDRDRFEIIPVAINKKGQWMLADTALVEQKPTPLPMCSPSPKNPLVTLAPYPKNLGDLGRGELVPLDGSHGGAPVAFDVLFPVMHGPMCEDGTIQGLFELAEIPYVGCGVLASSAGMDKEISKRLARDAGVTIVPYVAVKDGEWRNHASLIESQVKKELGYPVFVKPANMGSSVGVHRVKDASGLQSALTDAFRYDTKVLIEKAINAREVEVAVMENPEHGSAPLVSVAGEVAATHEFYSYEAKYLDDNGAALMIPAKLSTEQMDSARKMAGKVFATLECEGLARCDLFLEKDTGQFFFNEINTLPGFTSISMYPKMWEASGVGYKELLSKLIDLALLRYERKHRLAREFQAN